MDDPDRLRALNEYAIVDAAAVGVDAAQAGVAAGLTTGSQVSLNGLAQVAAAVCGTTAAVVNVIDDRYQHQVATHGVDPAVCTVQDSMCAVVLPQTSTVVVSDAAADQRFARNPFVTGRLGSLRFYASTPLIAPSGHPLGTLCVFDNQLRSLEPEQTQALEHLAVQVVGVFELQRHTRTLAAARDELARSNRVLTEFAGRISHDLKSPLTAVIGFAGTLQTLLADDERLSGFAGRISAAGQRMRALIDDLLAFASVGGRPTVTTVDLPELVADVTVDLEPLIAAARAKVSVQPATLAADRHQLRMLLQNLICNAVTYRHPGRPCRVDISCHADDLDDVKPTSRRTGGGEWRLRVTDNGLGIPSEHRGEVLQPLYRLARDGSIPGTGLGLATCTRVAEAHNGTISFDDTLDGGTVVTVTGRVGPP